MVNGRYALLLETKLIWHAKLLVNYKFHTKVDDGFLNWSFFFNYQFILGVLFLKASILIVDWGMYFK